MTPREIIKASLRKIGGYAVGETPTDQEMIDCLHALNAMLDSWNTDGLTVNAVQRVTKTLTANKATYTIGPVGADITNTQPISLTTAGLITSSGTLEIPIGVLSKEDWALVANKVSAGIPYCVYLQKQNPDAATGTLYLYYIPDNTHTLILYLNKQLAQIPETNAGLSADYALPPGYLRAIECNLAIELAPEWATTTSDELRAQANESLGKIKAANAEIPNMRCDTALRPFPYGWGTTVANINSGGFVQ